VIEPSEVARHAVLGTVLVTLAHGISDQSATRSPIAASDRAPASTAATEASVSEVSEWRMPRGSRGQEWLTGTPAGHGIRQLAAGRTCELLQGRTDHG
jgi:hypothetical protein